MEKNITIKNLIASITLQIVTIISGFIIPRLILNVFGSEVNGLVSSLNQFLNYIALIEGGLTGVMMASLYKPLSENDNAKVNAVVSAANKFYKKISLIFAVYTVILSILYPILVNTDFSFAYISTLTLVLSINLFIQYCFSLTWRILLQADKKVFYVATIQTLCIILNTFLLAILLNFYKNIHVAKLVTALIYLLQPLCFSKYVKKNYNIDLKVAGDKDAISQRWDGFGINIAAFIHTNTDVIILTLFTNLKNVSIYTIYNMIVDGLKRLINSISSGVAPTIGHVYAQGDIKKLNKLFDIYELAMYFVVFILFTLGGILITPFVQIYTNGVQDADYFQPVLGWILIVAEMLYCIREPYVNIAYCANKFKELSKYAYIEAGINIVLSILLVNKYGIVGVGVGTLVAMLYRTMVHIIYLKKNILYRKITIALKKILTFSLGMIISIVISKQVFAMVNITIISWMIYAIKNTLLVAFIYFILLITFYKDKIVLIKNILLRKEV